MSKPFILLITGISTAGKTTAYKHLKQDADYTDLRVHDVDETGIPQAGKGAWRVYKAEEYIHQAMQDCKKGISTVLVGIIPPHEVIEYQTYDKHTNLHFLLLKIDDATFEKRMQARLKRQKTTENYLEHFHSNLKLARNLENQIVNQKKGHIIRTSGLSEGAVYAKIKKLLTVIASAGRA